jgi:hypothetical protein
VDDVAQRMITITGPATVDGSGAYALDAGQVTSFVDDDTLGVLVGCRLEVLYAGSLLHGIGVALGEQTTLGALVQVEVRDQQLAVIATSGDHVVTSDDLNAQGGTHFTYISFDTPIDLGGPGDVYVLLRHVGGTNDLVQVGLSGQVALGSGLYFSNVDLAWHQLLSAPMVRGYLSPAVGVEEWSMEGPLAGPAFPVPANDMLHVPLVGPGTGPLTVTMTDPAGRMVRRLRLQPVEGMVTLTVHDLPAGAYVLAMEDGTGRSVVRVSVVH